MWNKSSFLKLYVNIKEKAGRRILIPILVCLQCLSSYLEDLADLIAMFPEKIRINIGKKNDMTLGQAATALREMIEALREMKDLRVRVNASEKNGNSVRVDIRAF